MRTAAELFLQNEERLTDLVYDYARRHGFAAHASSLREAWRLSISGLTSMLIPFLEPADDIPEIEFSNDFSSDPVGRFAVEAAVRHKKRGVDLGMFLGQMKYYRRSYLDLLEEADWSSDKKEKYACLIDRIFDRCEVSICLEWTKGDESRDMDDMRSANRLISEEKNKYLAIFETIPSPVIILDKVKRIDSMNLAAAALFRNDPTPGCQYYHPYRKDYSLEKTDGRKDDGQSCFIGEEFSKYLRFIEDEVNRFYRMVDRSAEFERVMEQNGTRRTYRVKLSKSLDLSDKFDGIMVILEDITTLRMALDEIRTLRGFIPICSHCKNIRDDQGYWRKVEQYIEDNSQVQFSHSICPDCMEKLYPEYFNEKDYPVRRPETVRQLGGGTED
jgi:PAS domain-containing protein